jgi:hypothetical protein
MQRRQRHHAGSAGIALLNRTLKHMLLRSSAIAVVVVALLTICWWLNVPRSLQLMAQGLGQQRHPVDFDIEFVGIDSNLSQVPVSLYYVPKTPILGISAHYWSSIAPFRIDTITRTFQVPVHEGRVRWTAPLGLAGFSNFRLQSINVGEAGAEYALHATTASDPPIDPSTAPRSLDIPMISVSGGEYRYDGAIALWRRTDGTNPYDANPYVYSPRADSSTLGAPLIWDGLRVLHARIDLAPYPIGTFVVPVDWEGEGWKNEGFQLARPHATLTDKALTLSRGVSVPLPFSRDCKSVPQFAVVAGNRIPTWSNIDGLWRPIYRPAWQELLRRAETSELDVRFFPRASRGASLDRVEFFTVLAHAGGTYRLFAACPNSHYASLGVTWIDVIARPTGAGKD